MKFDDSVLQQHFDRTVSLVTTLPKEIQQVFALMDAYGWIKATEGANSKRAMEILTHLTSSELRGPLKSWYLRHSTLNPAADEFRRMLEKAIGEPLPLDNIQT
jgi:hypothetical protein